MNRSDGIIRLLMAFTIVLAVGLQNAYPCSTFILKNEEALVFGGNLDFFTSKGLVLINKRGVAKTALLAPPEKPVSWISKYGSVTFNQVGRELPFGGMNEQGLVVQMMWLDDTGYPQPDERPAIMALQWIQYQLDYTSTVDEVIKSDSELRISGAQSMSRLHYLICDRQGNAAAVEFIEGQPVYRTGKALPVAALTNSTYDDCLAFHNAFDSLSGGEQIMRTSYDSRDRFARISRAIRDFESDDIRPAVEYAFDVLQSVSAVKRGGHCTAWSIVYDIENMQLSFKTFENRHVRTLYLRDFDFACSSPAMALDMTWDLEGNVSSGFLECTLETNTELVTSVMKIYSDVGFMDQAPGPLMQILSNYPELLKCE